MIKKIHKTSKEITDVFMDTDYMFIPGFMVYIFWFVILSITSMWNVVKNEKTKIRNIWRRKRISN